MAQVPQLGRVGIWAIELRFGDKGEIPEAAAELDELGFGALWFPGGHGGDVTGAAELLLGATKRATVATGILNLWFHEPADVAGWWRALPDGQRDRMLLGLGVGHANAVGEAWGKPVERTRGYLEAIGAAGLPAEAMCLAALGPRMLALAGELTAGAHPYLVSPKHTARARAILGPGKLLAVEQGVVLECDAARARELAREAVHHYAQQPNYCNSWRRLGFSDEDIATKSDWFIDSIFAWGSSEDIAGRVKAHHDAGADHVCMQVVTAPGSGMAGVRPIWRELAAALL
jgi:probable F420-dependent oxidoreductase